MKVSIAESRFAVNPIGNTCLVIDVLRATSVMAVLLEHGVKQIYLADSIESARDLKANLLLPEEVLMIGERNSLPPDDFDGGNSPLVPNISGQNKDYLIVKLKEYKTNKIQHPQMSMIAQMLTDKDIEDVSNWYSSIKVEVFDPEKVLVINEID